MAKQSNWHYPAPRPGLAGQWDKFIGPGASTLEQALSLIPSAFAAIAISYYAYTANLGWSPTQYLVAALIAFDVVGGVATNATSSAKRWYHRDGQTASQHMYFVAVHFLQILLVAYFFRDADITYFLGTYGYLLVASIIVLQVPLRIQRSIALLLVCGAIVISQYLFSPTRGFEWFIPVLFIKLLISHLTTEEPYL